MIFLYYWYIVYILIVMSQITLPRFYTVGGVRSDKVWLQYEAENVSSVTLRSSPFHEERVAVLSNGQTLRKFPCPE
jgi:hypothetical protein